MLSLHPAQFPSPSLYLSDIHSNDPCLSHAGTMLWIPSKQKNKWRLLCKWLCGGTCAGVERKKKWWCLYPCVFVGRQPEREEQERSECNKKMNGCKREEESKERRIKNQNAANADRVVWQDVLWKSITSNSSFCVCARVCMWEMQIHIVFALTDRIFLHLIHVCLSLMTDFDHLYTDTHAQILPACSFQWDPNWPGRQKAEKEKAFNKINNYINKRRRR